MPLAGKMGAGLWRTDEIDEAIICWSVCSWAVEKVAEVDASAGLFWGWTASTLAFQWPELGLLCGKPSQISEKHFVKKGKRFVTLNTKANGTRWCGSKEVSKLRPTFILLVAWAATLLWPRCKSYTWVVPRAQPSKKTVCKYATVQQNSERPFKQNNAWPRACETTMLCCA